MKRYVLARPAQEDLDEIRIDIATRSGSIDATERMFWSLYRKIVSLAGSSGTGQRCDDIDEGGRLRPNRELHHLLPACAVSHRRYAYFPWGARSEEGVEGIHCKVNANEYTPRPPLT